MRDDSEVHYGNDQIFYINVNGDLCLAYKSSGNWVTGYVKDGAQKVKAGTGFALVPEQNNTIYYIGADDNIYKLYWTSSNGWVYTKLNQSSSNISGGKQNHDIIFADDQIFYVGKNDTRVHRLQNVYSIPFTVDGSTVGKPNKWDVSGTDGADVAYKFVLNNATNISATTSYTQTTIKNSKIQIYDYNRKSIAYKLIGSPTSGNKLETNLAPGLYYIVVDGYDEGNFRLTVNQSSLKNADQSEIRDNDLVNDQNIENIIHIYPNPAHEIVNLSFAKEGNYLIELFDLNDRLLYNAKTSNSLIELDCSNYQNGMYIIKVSSSEQLYLEKLIIK